MYSFIRYNTTLHDTRASGLDDGIAQRTKRTMRIVDLDRDKYPNL